MQKADFRDLPMTKKQFINQPYSILAITIPVVLAVSFFRKSFIIDVQLSDTYYAGPIPLLSGFFAIILMIEALLYWLIRKKQLIELVTWIHVLGSVLAILFLVVLAGSPQNANLSGTFLSAADFQRDQEHNTQIVFGILIWIVCQILFCLNLAVGLIRNVPVKKVVLK
jgi:hypothetical protein